MNEFLRFFDEIIHRYPMHMVLSYSKTTDWLLHVWREGTDDNGKNEDVLWEQDCDLDYVLARAQVDLKDWLTRNMGGY